MEHKMRMVETAKLVPYINNARTHSPAQIAKLRASIREFGFLNPVIIDGGLRYYRRAWARAGGAGGRDGKSSHACWRTI